MEKLEDKNIRIQKIVNIKTKEFKKAEILASYTCLADLINILNITDNKEKTENLIEFDLKQLNIIYENLDIIIEKWLDFSINLYPYTLLNKLKIVKWFLKRINKKIKKSWKNIQLFIEIVENGGINQKEYLNIIYQILSKYKNYKMVFDDVVILNDWNDLHFLKMINKILKKNYLNVKTIKFDIQIIKRCNVTKLIKLFNILSKYIITKDIVFEGVEEQKELNKIIKAVKIYNKTHDNKINSNKIFIQWFYYHKPKEIYEINIL